MRTAARRGIGLPAAALRHAGLVFLAGFVLGTVRTLWLTPALGERAAELAELPVLVLVSWRVARAVVGRLTDPTWPRRMAVGLGALGLLVLAELGVVTLVRHQSLAAYVADRDPVAGLAYVAALLAFAAAPVAVGRPGRA